MQSLIQDLRYGMRMLLKSRGFTAAAVLTLALGIGANTAIFSLVDAVMIHPLPFRTPEQLVMLWEKPPGFDHNTVSPLTFLDWKEQAGSFESMAAVAGGSSALTGDGDPVQVPSQLISASFFDLLGVSLPLGRGFTSEDEQPGKNDVAILSHGLWTRRFGGDRNLVGKTITLDGRPVTVIGVLPVGFRLLNTTDIWRPLVLRPDVSSRNNHFLRVIARLKPGVTLESARAEMDVIAKRIAQAAPQTNQGWGVKTSLLQQELIGSDLRVTSKVLLGAVGMVLLIACANVAGLQLIRGAGRAREIAVRLSVGAGRLRIARQLLTESMLLSLAGAAVALPLAKLALDAAPSLVPAGTLPTLVQLEFNWRVVAFAVVAALFTGALCGLTPATHAGNINLNAILRSSGRSSTGGNKLRRGLAVAEIAMALVLAVGGVLLARTLLALEGVDRGYRADRVLSFHVTLPPGRYASPQAILQFHQKTLSELNALPGVRAAALAYDLPLEGWSYGSRFQLGTRAAVLPAGLPFAHFQAVSSRYFEMLEVPITRGRAFAEADMTGSEPVCIVNQELANRYSANADPVGRQLFPEDGAPPGGCKIVGVSGQVKIQGPAEASRMEFYVPYPMAASTSVVYGVRTDAEPKSLVPAARELIHRIDADMPLVNPQTLEEIASASVARPRFRAGLVGAFAVLSLLLAIIGIYGVVAYAVSQRTGEFGIRIAVGARTPDILRLVLGDGLQMVLLGVGIGAAAAAGLTHYLSTMLFGVQPLDLLTFVTVPILLTLAVLGACYMPARRATRVDPILALRYE